MQRSAPLKFPHERAAQRPKGCVYLCNLRELRCTARDYADVLVAAPWPHCLPRQGGRNVRTDHPGAFTGRLGRAIATDFVKAAAAPDAPAATPYPVQRGLTAAMKEAGTAAGDYHRMQVWAGQSAAMAKPIPARDFVLQMWEDAQAFL